MIVNEFGIKEIPQLKNQIIKSIRLLTLNCEKDENNKVIKYLEDCIDCLIFTTVTGEEYAFWFTPDCCADVNIEDISGDLNNLIGSPLLKAEISNKERENDCPDDTWTYYHFATVKGHVDIRWYGTSNGYYCTDVNFGKLEKRDKHDKPMFYLISANVKDDLDIEEEYNYPIDLYKRFEVKKYGW